MISLNSNEIRRSNIMRISFVWILGVVVVLLYMIISIINKEHTYAQKEEVIDEKNLLMPYKRKFLLTKTEYLFYKELKVQCDQNNLLICPKVRLEDIVEVTDKDNLYKYRGYVKSRHIDFLICNDKLHMLGAIELDDKSHNRKSAQKTDEFKDNLFRTIDMPLFRIKVESINYNEKINQIIRSLNINDEEKKYEQRA